jgi:hypothetical protein
MSHSFAGLLQSQKVQTIQIQQTGAFFMIIYLKILQQQSTNHLKYF